MATEYAAIKAFLQKAADNYQMDSGLVSGTSGLKPYCRSSRCEVNRKVVAAAGAESVEANCDLTRKLRNARVKAIR